MNLLIRCIVVGVCISGWLAADAAAQIRSRGAMPPDRSKVAGDEVDYAVTLRDPFSPIGYHPPVLESKASMGINAVVSNVPPPSIDLNAKAKKLLRVSGIVKRGNTYVANVNGAIVKAGDEVNVTVDGQRVAFIIRAISLKRVEIEPR